MRGHLICMRQKNGLSKSTMCLGRVQTDEAADEQADEQAGTRKCACIRHRRLSAACRNKGAMRCQSNLGTDGPQKSKPLGELSPASGP
mmetsp:Transcript_78505/g.206652  ORF Transcript_78505/g.206652 Transcript_78505/m.206652 type:complete len:88 (-) Transcript_78505:40-303(-)